jgi:hypothetical protein
LSTDDAENIPAARAMRAASVPNFLCNGAQSFGKEWETVSVSGLPRTKATNPKQEKEITLMKNRNIQFKPAAGLLIPLLLACFAAVFISGTIPSVAGDMVPFNGTVSGYVESQEPVDQCTVHAHVVNFGNANQLGAFTGTAEFYPNFCEDPPNITYTGMFDWFAANGDEIVGTFDGYLTDPDMDGVYDNHETATITGGTGRFTNATGSFSLGGQIDFTTNPPSFVLPWQGVISSVGSTRH